MKELKIRQCVLVRESNEKNILAAKRISSEKIPVSFLNYRNVVSFVQKSEGKYFNIGLIFREKSLHTITEILRIFDKVTLNDKYYFQNITTIIIFLKEKISYKMAFFKWLIFLTDPKADRTHYRDKLIIPYNCEFIVIQARNSTNYQLTEYYEIKSSSYSLDFGTWDSNSGLRGPDVTFYSKRINMHRNRIMVINFNKDVSQDRKFIYC